MVDFVGSLWWLVVSLGILVTFHEFGHFWVARRCGVRVLRFSVGFGNALWSRNGTDGTEYRLAMIPLGGYVKMLDEREGDVPESQAAHAFNRQSVWKRMAIVVAGPLANLVLCVAMLWATFVIGRPDYAPVVGRSEGIAAAAGMHAGDALLEIDGHATPTWSEAQAALLPASLDRRDVAARVRDASGSERTLRLALSRIPAGVEETRVVDATGIVPRHRLQPAIVGAIRADSAAGGVLRAGDRIVAIDGQPVRAFDDIGPLVQQLGARGGPGMVEAQRAGERLALEMQPRQSTDPAQKGQWVLGIQPPAPTAPAFDAELQFGPVAAIPAAFAETRFQLGQLFGMIGRAFTGRISVQNTVGGPITIARATNALAQQGPAWYLTIHAVLSLGLAVLNLLPIPLLDGGHLLYYLIELVKGSPLSERAMAAGQYVGLALLAGLMGLAFYNDIVNNFLR